LAVGGSCWQLLAVVGSCWQLLAVVGSCWQLLAVVVTIPFMGCAPAKAKHYNISTDMFFLICIFKTY
jgi:hypothetical protein